MKKEKWQIMLRLNKFCTLIEVLLKNLMWVRLFKWEAQSHSSGLNKLRQLQQSQIFSSTAKTTITKPQNVILQIWCKSIPTQLYASTSLRRETKESEKSQTSTKLLLIPSIKKFQSISDSTTITSMWRSTQRNNS